ncbi:hypothetical protein BDV93DRAFT_557802 [Ceratobasidium sp. AG-I]|nr:hypothetical protein BDV93DRAFT_557802 [Ceratobasidium sp. AG-I]
MLIRRLLLIAFTIKGVEAGNTTYKSNSLDWFTESVGETPCRVYERLRQTCSPSFQVGNIKAVPPGDTCNDQVSACCCNSTAFALSMLCMNCQYGVGTSIGDDHGFDAGVGSLPNITQTAVCNQNINIPSYVYTLFWGSGTTGNWFYEYTKGAAQLQVQSGQNRTTFCNTVTPGSSESDPEPNIGAVVGGVVGGVGLLAIAALVWFFSRRRKSRRRVVDLSNSHRSPNMMFEPFHIQPAPLAQTVAHASHSGPSSSGRAYPNSSSDAVSNSNYPPTRAHKSGAIASYPPNRHETHDAHGLLSPDGVLHASERHEDSEALSSAFGLGRSGSGRLPPSYEQH